MSNQQKTLRRCRRYSGRLMRTATGSGLRHNLVFMHMPKCGGTSLSEALYATVPIARRIGVIDALSTRRAAAMQHFGTDDAWLCHDDLPNGALTFDLRKTLMLTHMAWGTGLIHGHLLYCDQVQHYFKAQYQMITVLRPPQERMISNYRMAVHAGLAARSFSDYVRTDLARQHAQVYLRYLSGQARVPENDVAGTTHRALKNAQNFAFIGFLDQPKALRDGFQDRFTVGLNLPTYNTARAEQPDISPQDQQHMAALLAPDQEIFDQLRQRYL